MVFCTGEFIIFGIQRICGNDKVSFSMTINDLLEHLYGEDVTAGDECFKSRNLTRQQVSGDDIISRLVEEILTDELFSAPWMDGYTDIFLYNMYKGEM